MGRSKVVAWYTIPIGREINNATFVAFKVSSLDQVVSNIGIGNFAIYATSDRGLDQEAAIDRTTCTNIASLERFVEVATSLRSMHTGTNVVSLAVATYPRTIFQERIDPAIVVGFGEVSRRTTVRI